jgi:replicative DNA helicase
LREHPIELIAIDYLQYISGDKGKSTADEIQSITRVLKGLAKDLEVPLLLLSQLNRKCEERTDKRPLLSDLRDSGAIEQDADLVIFIYRPEVYSEPDKYGNQQPGVTEINVAKQRNGPLGHIRLLYDKATTTFKNWG